MKLDIVFGSDGTKKRVDWDKDVMLFPKLMLFQGKKWEWAMYKETPYADYELVFSQLPSYDPNFYVSDYVVFEDTFERKIGCECGAHWTSFPNFHMFYCKKWTAW